MPFPLVFGMAADERRERRDRKGHAVLCEKIAASRSSLGFRGVPPRLLAVLIAVVVLVGILIVVLIRVVLVGVLVIVVVLHESGLLSFVLLCAYCVREGKALCEKNWELFCFFAV